MLYAGKEGGAGLVPAQPSHGADAHFENAPNTPGSRFGSPQFPSLKNAGRNRVRRRWKGFSLSLSLSALSGEDDGGLSQSGEGKREDGRRSASPADPVHFLSAFTRKTGAFVNKPGAQVRQSTATVSCTTVACGFCYVFALLCCLGNHSQPGPALLCVCLSRPGLRRERSYGN